MLEAAKVIIFDFDGVLVESNDIKTAAFEHVFSRFPGHQEEMMAFHREQVSASRFIKFDRLLALAGKSGDINLRAELAEEFSSYVAAKIIQCPWVEGAEDLLAWLENRIPLYLASVTPEAELEGILKGRGLEKRFRKIYGCPPWKKPDAVRDVLARESIQPELAVLIGDSAGDQRAAEETGIRFIARNSGLEFDRPHPLTFSNLNEIKKFMESML